MTLRITNRLFGTNPIAVHCPGPLHDRWHLFAAEMRHAPVRQCVCPDVTLLTWNSGERRSRPTKPCGVLEGNLKQLGLTALVCGQGIKSWKNRDKFATTAEALQKVKPPYVIGADSADVLFLDNPQIIVDRFRQHHTCKLLFNATGSRCWPELPEFVAFQSSLPMAALTQGRHWINSGLFIGETTFVRNYMQALANEPPVRGFEDSDQAVVMRSWPKWYPDVQADYLSELFQWFNEDLCTMQLQRAESESVLQWGQWLKSANRAANGVDLGAGDGRTSEAILRNLPDVKVWLIDSWSHAGGPIKQAAATMWTEFANRRRFFLNDSLIPASTRFTDASVDFVCFNAIRMTKGIAAEIRGWWPKLASGGLMMGLREQSSQNELEEFASAVDRDISGGAGKTWLVRK